MILPNNRQNEHSLRTKKGFSKALSNTIVLYGGKIVSKSPNGIPVPPLQLFPGLSITIVSPENYYHNSRSGPIFPALDPFYLPGAPYTYYINLYSPGTFLAYLETILLRYPSATEQYCSLSSEPTRETYNQQIIRGKDFLMWTLTATDINSSISLRLPESLDG